MMKSAKTAAMALAIAMTFSLAAASSADAGLLGNLFSRSSHNTVKAHPKKKCSSCDQMKSDYRGCGKQPGYRSFYRYNAFFPGHNQTSPYGYDYF